MVVTEGERPDLESTNHPDVLSDILRQRYLLRGLLWCGRCEKPWVPILLPPMARYYVCSNRECPHPAMPAKLMEQRVWSRFLGLQEGALPRQVPRERRHELLRTELTRVVVGWWIGEVRLEWRE